MTKPIRIASFAIQPDHPGIDPKLKIKKRKTKKVDRSLFTHDCDARKQYITNIESRLEDD